MAGFISIHDPEQLKGCFGRLKRPRGYASIDVPDANIELGPLKISKLREGWRALTAKKRFHRAAYSWLRPEQPHTLTEIRGMQDAAGLDHIEKEAFCTRLVSHCRHIMRTLPELRRWGESRIALLEFELAQPKLPEILSYDVAMMLNTELLGAAFLMGVDDVAARECAAIVSAEALQAAAQAVAHMLGREGPTCHLNANLMVEVHSGTPAGPKFKFHARATENSRKAAKLWEGERWDRCLVIVAETVDSKCVAVEHVGFWVPMIRKQHGETLPGASTAFARMAGDAVFKDDMPRMAAFDSRLAARWRNFVAENIEEKLFVSLPLIVPNQHGRAPVAVLNVNADPPEDHPWCRAHHPEWLGLATTACGRSSPLLSGPLRS